MVDYLGDDGYSIMAKLKQCQWKSIRSIKQKEEPKSQVLFSGESSIRYVIGDIDKIYKNSRNEQIYEIFSGIS